MRAIPTLTAGLATLTLLAGTALGTSAQSPETLLPPTGPAANGLIAFDAADDIWVVNPDGSDPRQLTSGPALEFAPVWSRDGTRLAYWSAESLDAPASLIVVDVDGSDPLTIATGHFSYLDWSPDGSHIAYGRCPDYGESCGERIVVAATDGSGFAQVGDPELTARVPVWSPDGTQIAFTGHRAGLESGIYLMAPDGSGVRRLSQVLDDNKYAFFTLDWSPDGSGLVTNAAGSQIWVSAADGSSERAITDAEGALGPSWSSDGERIAYWILGTNELRVIPAEGGAVTALGSMPKGYAWSPDGTRLAVLGRLITTGGSGPGLAIIDAATGKVFAEVEAANSIQQGTQYPSWQRVAP